MSVLIKGMEMPCACVDCELYEADLYWCLGAKKEVPYSPVDKHAEFCPLVEVPTPHGRLVDIDEVYKVLSEQYHHTTDLQHTALREALAKVPTALEAEGGGTDVNSD